VTGAVVDNLVSTIIPVFNRPDMVCTAVHSVLQQTYRPIEILLVDDGSTDHTPEVLALLQREHPDEVRVLRQANAGPGAARERGRLAARGAYIQYLDSDDWLLPNKFADQVAALQRSPDCSIAYGTARLVAEDGTLLAEPSRRTAELHRQLFPLLLQERWWHTHTPLFRRSISDAAGPWPRFRPEDWDLEARMGALGAQLVHCGSTVSCQRDHALGDRVSRGLQADYLRDEARFLPRLFACALLAGVPPQAPQWHHLARWCLLRSRQLHALGAQAQGDQILALSRQVACGLPDGTAVVWRQRCYQLLCGSVGTGLASRMTALVRPI
jgi:glycosyltransferase involved in cell wall biosynthesis